MGEPSMGRIGKIPKSGISIFLFLSVKHSANGASAFIFLYLEMGGYQIPNSMIRIVDIVVSDCGI
jgi:hypothetical protein